MFEYTGSLAERIVDWSADRLYEIALGTRLMWRRSPADTLFTFAYFGVANLAGLTCGGAFGYSLGGVPGGMLAASVLACVSLPITHIAFTTEIEHAADEYDKLMRDRKEA